MPSRRRTTTSSDSAATSPAKSTGAGTRSARSTRAAAASADSANDSAASAAGAAAGAAADSGRAAADAAGSAAGQLGGGVEATIQRIRDLNERVISEARSAGEASLDTYEKALQSFVDMERSMADRSQVDWLSNAVRTHADFVAKMTDTYVSALRKGLKQ